MFAAIPLRMISQFLRDLGVLEAAHCNGQRIVAYRGQDWTALMIGSMVSMGSTVSAAAMVAV